MYWSACVCVRQYEYRSTLPHLLSSMYDLIRYARKPWTFIELIYVFTVYILSISINLIYPMYTK